MTKALLTICSLLLSLVVAQAQVTTATNFNAADCDGNMHDLFAELNAGKVVVMAFVMPCGACTGPSVTASNVVQQFESTNPGAVKFYVVDDAGNTSCTTLTNWASGEFTNTPTIITNSSISQTAYGTAGMPKIVVVGGGSHGVFFNKNNSASNDAAGIEAAINSALQATSVNGVDQTLTEMSLAQGTDKAVLDYTLVTASNVDVSIYNMLGSRVSTVINQQQSQGQHQLDIPFTNLANGMYFLNVNTSAGSRTVKFNVSR